MPSTEENLHLCWLLLQQKMENGKLENIDWSPITAALGLANNSAATMRWSRLKKELTDNSVPIAPIDGTPKKATKKAANPKAKKAAEESGDGDDEKPVKKRAAKKRKVEAVQEESDGIGKVEEETNMEVGDGHEAMEESD